MVSRSIRDTALLRSQVFPEGRARTLKIDELGIEYRKLNGERASETNKMIRLNDTRGAGSQSLKRGSYALSWAEQGRQKWQQIAYVRVGRPDCSTEKAAPPGPDSRQQREPA